MFTSNASRFLNHSCNPCLSPFIFVRESVNSRQFPQLGFFFISDVVPGMEITIHYGENYWDNAAYDCSCGTSNCHKPSRSTTYRNMEDSDRVKAVHRKENKLNKRLVQEAKACKQRMEHLKQGKTMEQAMQLVPAFHTKDKPKRIKNYGFYDRCPCAFDERRVSCAGLRLISCV